ncbi:hypothetical protein [Candidatus Accumulibacter sp. ACC003]|uniref:hypothetical protein n=1 Tax=Candidatus Accumulibacter sp. ACC003 TaxID=2823334 RepID=UPI0025BCF661|nr:hypothetical protein [Candidatus Accumulibacter sp. ACC003]
MPIDLNDVEALRRRVAELEGAQHASVSAAGALAQGGGDVLGERGAKVGGDNSGTIVTGTIVTGTQIVRASSCRRTHIWHPSSSGTHTVIARRRSRRGNPVPHSDFFRPPHRQRERSNDASAAISSEGGGGMVSRN